MASESTRERGGTDAPSGAVSARAVEVETDIGALLLHADDPAMTVMIRRDGRWEPEISTILRERLRPGDTFVDVGANVGYHAVLGARLTGPTGRVVAVEPEPRNHQLLTANLRRHATGSHSTIAAAALDTAGTVEFWLSEGDFGNHSTVPISGAGRTMQVPAVRLDDVLADDPRVTLVKIDAEGADQLVVRGMEAVLRSARPAVIVEFIPNDLALKGEDPQEILGYYRSLGLDVHVVEGTTRGPGQSAQPLPGVDPAPRRADDAAVFAAAGRHPGGMCNLLLLPN